VVTKDLITPQTQLCPVQSYNYSAAIATFC